MFHSTLSTHPHDLPFTFGRKQGFSVPLKNWLKEGPFRDFFYDVLLDKESIFDKNEIIKTLNANAKGRNNSEKILLGSPATISKGFCIIQLFG